MPHTPDPADTPTEHLRADRHRAALARPVPLGDELPLFCERCGYSLNGCPQTVCAHCAIRHFACPECGHHQPINTLRPAAQRVLGRIRSFGLAAAMVFRVNFFGWILVAWGAAGGQLAYGYSSRFGGASTFGRRELEADAVLAVICFGIPFGLIGRLQLLRWPRGYRVGAVLGVLTAAAMLVGAYVRMSQRSRHFALPSPITADFVTLMSVTAVAVAAGAAVAWPVWVSLVQLMLPRKAATALLDWQRSESDQALTDLARDPAHDPAVR